MPDVLKKWLVLSALGSSLLLVSTACGGATRETSTPTATATSVVVTPTPSVTQSPYAQILAAYRRYWEVYADAILRLDDSRLGEVMTGPRLDRARQEIRDLTSQGHAVRIVVENEPVLGTINGNEATLLDVYKNASYLVDATTKQPIAGTGTPNMLKDAVTLVRVGDVWKVRDSIRQASP
ncbi:MAG: hypothetical protein C4558_08975 [Dehalococcoidia bacterium]|nr:MAG: hypothetical protein C4558_08975 [Dehalococcoidia bacterium]